MDHLSSISQRFLRQLLSHLKEFIQICQQTALPFSQQKIQLLFAIFCSFQVFALFLRDFFSLRNIQRNVFVWNWWEKPENSQPSCRQQKYWPICELVGGIVEEQIYAERFNEDFFVFIEARLQLVGGFWNWPNFWLVIKNCN